MCKKIVYLYFAFVGALLLIGALSQAQVADAPLAVRPYHVTDAGTFPSLPLPVHSLIFRNGLYQTPGLDYDAVGTTFRFHSNVLSNGDILSVVTLP